MKKITGFILIFLLFGCVSSRHASNQKLGKVASWNEKLKEGKLSLSDYNFLVKGLEELGQ